MKDVKNNKGFSLIEVLATIVIIGIVSTIGIVSVNRMIEQSRQHYYESQEQQMVLAAQSYVNDNRNILPKNVGGMIKIYLSTLREKNYLKEDIVDQDKRTCYKDKSYVAIYKSSQSEYKYRGYLECPACTKNGDSSCYSADNKIKPVIEIKFPDSGNQGNDLFNKDKKIEINLKSIETPTDKPEIKLASYSYKIYVNNVLKYDSGTKIDNKRTTHTINEEIYKYVPGVVKVVVTLTNTDGATTSKTASKNYSDLANPSCGMITYEGQKPLKAYDSHTNPKPECGEKGYEWINISSNPNNRVVWVVCNDVTGIGCAQHEFSQSFTSDGEDDKIFIKDKNGNSDLINGCTVKKCIDRTTPKITVDIYSPPTSTDKPTGTPVKSYTVEPQGSQFNYLKEETHPDWLNKANFPHGVLVKVKVEDPTSDIKSFTWKINPKNQNESNVTAANTTIKTKSDLDKGVVTYLITDDGVRKQDITVVDKAGNTVRYILTLKIDRTPPSAPTISGYKKNSSDNASNENGLENYYSEHWTSKYVLTKASGSVDNPNVSGVEGYYLTSSGQKEDVTDSRQIYRNINKENTAKVKWRAKDVAGNWSGFSDWFITKQDRTDPNIEFTVTSSGGTIDGKYKNNVHIKVSCSDSYSGVKTFTIGGDNASNPSTYSRSERGTLSKSAYCKDNVGNDSSESHSYTVVKSGTSCSHCSCTSYDYYWYVCTNGYSGELVDCKSPATYGGKSCGPGNLGVAQVVSSNLRAECKQGSCTGCGPCWY